MCNNLDESQGIALSEKSQFPKVMYSRIGQNFFNGEKISGWECKDGLGQKGREVDVLIKWQHEGSLWKRNCSVSWMWWWMPKPVWIHTHSHTHTHNVQEICIRSVDYINVHILVVILYYGFVKGYYRGNWVKGTQNLSVLYLTSACECIVINKSFHLQKLFNIH